ncbi:MAG: Stp1/IreP family PP2C-type Ser/Thr phosphatase [Acidobacteriota bacterium]
MESSRRRAIRSEDRSQPARISRGLSLREAVSAVLARRRDRGPVRRTVRTSSRPRERNAVRADDDGFALDDPREMRARQSLRRLLVQGPSQGRELALISSAALSDVGRWRQTNQDACLVNDELHLYLLADGMGGHAAGGTASKMTVETIDEFVRTAASSNPRVSWPFGYDERIPFQHNVLQSACRLANLRVCRQAEQKEGCAGMGSTIVSVWILNGKAYYSHLGDSRLYLLRSGGLDQLTEDHSMVQQQLKLGVITEEQARTHAFKNVITRAIGVPDNSEIPVGEVVLEKGDRLMLACDGLTDQLTDPVIRWMLLQESDLRKACRNLVEAANQTGGPDNITVVLVDYDA